MQGSNKDTFREKRRGRRDEFRTYDEITRAVLIYPTVHIYKRMDGERYHSEWAFWSALLLIRLPPFYEYWLFLLLKPFQRNILLDTHQNLENN